MDETHLPDNSLLMATRTPKTEVTFPVLSLEIITEDFTVCTDMCNRKNSHLLKCLYLALGCAKLVSQRHCVSAQRHPTDVETGDLRQETGDRRQETGDWRMETGDKIRLEEFTFTKI